MVCVDTGVEAEGKETWKPSRNKNPLVLKCPEIPEMLSWLLWEFKEKKKWLAVVVVTNVPFLRATTKPNFTMAVKSLHLCRLSATGNKASNVSGEKVLLYVWAQIGALWYRGGRLAVVWAHLSVLLNELCRSVDWWNKWGFSISTVRNLSYY